MSFELAPHKTEGFCAGFRVTAQLFWQKKQKLYISLREDFMSKLERFLNQHVEIVLCILLLAMLALAPALSH